MDTEDTTRLLNAAVEAAMQGDERSYVVNLAASHVLDGVIRHLQRKWPEVDSSMIEMVTAKAAEALYGKLVDGGIVRSPAGYLWGAARNQLLKYHAVGLAAPEHLDEVLKSREEGEIVIDLGEDADREAMLTEAIRFARSVLPSLGHTTVTQVMKFILDCIERGELYIDNRFISDSLGLTTDTVRKAKHRGFQRLQREAERYGIKFGAEVMEVANTGTDSGEDGRDD